ncbi:unnamed protein product [Miscanthus lutarioriparius]|uniref:Uncharacterized protein n=1 Tax=Miscanthus lutarioriparius TaxID=422564 RepID=A0A811RYU6_9POAL|nr:unnamed protein product [Miscanthus lutarioriparius]
MALSLAALLENAMAQPWTARGSSAPRDELPPQLSDLSSCRPAGYSSPATRAGLGLAELMPSSRQLLQCPVLLPLKTPAGGDELRAARDGLRAQRGCGEAWGAAELRRGRPRSGAAGRQRGPGRAGGGVAGHRRGP